MAPALPPRHEQKHFGVLIVVGVHANTDLPKV